MRIARYKSARAFSFAVAILGSTSLVSALIYPDAVNAANGKGSEKSSSKDNGRAKSNNSASDGGSSNNARATKPGTHPKFLGALNSANASEVARANASPNSRVGLTAAYAEEVETTRKMAADLARAQAVLDEMPVPTRTSDEVIVVISSKTKELSDTQKELEDKQALVGTADATEGLEDEILTLQAKVGSLNAEIDLLEQEKSDTEDYETAEQAVDDLNESLASQIAAQRQALELAGNKTVTDDVEDQVQRLLGIFDDLLPTAEHN